MRNGQEPKDESSKSRLTSFFVDENGKQVSEAVKKQVRTALTGYWTDMVTKDNETPVGWRESGLARNEHFYDTMVKKFYFLGLGEGDWKVSQVWTNYLSGFKNNTLPKLRAAKGETKADAQAQGSPKTRPIRKASQGPDDSGSIMIISDDSSSVVFVDDPSSAVIVHDDPMLAMIISDDESDPDSIYLSHTAPISTQSDKVNIQVPIKHKHDASGPGPSKKSKGKAPATASSFHPKRPVPKKKEAASLGTVSRPPSQFTKN
jgi:hypothetical protein